MEEIIIKDNTFRIKSMNAIELLALQSQFDFNTYDSAYKLFSVILERMEVKCGDKWLPVKEKGREVYYPAGIENDPIAIKELIMQFTKYVKSVFPKSNG